MLYNGTAIVILAMFYCIHNRGTVERLRQYRQKLQKLAWLSHTTRVGRKASHNSSLVYPQVSFPICLWTQDVSEGKVKKCLVEDAKS